MLRVITDQSTILQIRFSDKDGDKIFFDFQIVSFDDSKSSWSSNGLSDERKGCNSPKNRESLHVEYLNEVLIS